MSSIGLKTNSNYTWGWDVSHDQALEDFVYFPIREVLRPAARNLEIPWLQ
jgi:hypothetical protein